MSRIKEIIKKDELGAILSKETNVMIETNENIFYELVSNMLVPDGEYMTANKFVFVITKSDVECSMIKQIFWNLQIHTKDIKSHRRLEKKYDELKESQYETPDYQELQNLGLHIFIKQTQLDDKNTDSEKHPIEYWDHLVHEHKQLDKKIGKYLKLKQQCSKFEKSSITESDFEESKISRLKILEENRKINTGIYVVSIGMFKKYISPIQNEYELIFFDLDGIIENFGKQNMNKIQHITELLEWMISEATKITCIDMYLTQRSFIFLNASLRNKYIRVVSIEKEIDIPSHKQSYSYVYENKWINTLIDKLQSNKVILFVSYRYDMMRMKKYINDHDKIHKSHIIDNLLYTFMDEISLLRMKTKLTIGDDVVIFANLINNEISWSDVMKSFQHLSMINEIHIVMRINQTFHLSDKDTSLLIRSNIKFIEDSIQNGYNIQVLERFGLNKYILTKFKKGGLFTYEYPYKDEFYVSFVWNAYDRILSVNYFKDLIIQLLYQSGYINTVITDKGTSHRIGGYSLIAIQWLEFMRIRDDTYIRHAINEGEFKIPSTKYHADGYSANLNKVYEFHGDVFHGNPKSKIVMKDPNKIFYKFTFAERYQKTIDREKRIKLLGYDLEVMWEQDWRDIVKSIIIIQRWWKYERTRYLKSQKIDLKKRNIYQYSIDCYYDKGSKEAR
jgi:hypothetical protein